MENKKKEAATHDGDHEIEDETKMEMFYSLLRSFRDARDRRRRELLQQELEKNDEESKSRKKMKTKKAEASFEWEDFTSEIQFRKPPLIFPKPIPRDSRVTDNKGKKKEEQQQLHRQNLDLDLKLAL
ncbi:hypothetical protein RIF29_22307 [Crotalaria pallida]|uniref:Uncharacterized protein n=1 Tax=Crotalaria pallida TaxID=3830 RepID=A0AAN9IA93_CROPI